MNTTESVPCNDCVCMALLRKIDVVEQKCDSILDMLSVIKNRVNPDLSLSVIHKAAEEMYEQSKNLRSYVEKTTFRLKIVEEGCV